MNFVPYVIEKTSAGERSYDILTVDCSKKELYS